MSENIFIGKNAAATEISQQFDSYSRVTIVVNDDIEYTTGTDSGRELVIECPWGTQAMAENILTMLTGYQYQPYEAQDALLHPAAELGDAITVNGVMGGVYSQTQTFNRLMPSTVSAPHDEEIDHEYPYIPKETREYKRSTESIYTAISQTEEAITFEATRIDDIDASVTSILTTYPGMIEAKVSKTDGAKATFGWKLTDESWELYSNNKTVLKADASGLEVSGTIRASAGDIGGFTIGGTAIYKGITSVSDTAHDGVYLGNDGIVLGKGIFKVDSAGNATVKGKVTATSGYIGNGSSGFTISSKAIANGKTSRDETTNNGIYIGTDGIALGKGNFVVTNTGALTAKSATLTGTITATGGYIGSASEGFTIKSNKFYNGKTSLGSTAAGVYIGTDGISVGNLFKVDRNGNLTANKGTFTGAVHAGNIKSTGVDGYGGSFSGSGITSKSVNKSRTVQDVQDTLDQVGVNANNIAGIFEMFDDGLFVDFLEANDITIYGDLACGNITSGKILGYRFEWNEIRTVDGSVYALCRRY